MDLKMVIAVRTDLKMRRGKESAQVGHASMAWIVGYLNGGAAPSERTQRWATGGQTKIVVAVDSEAELLALIAKARSSLVDVHEIHDAGRTEIPSGTLTCAGFGPDLPSILDPLLGHLKLR